MKSLAIKNPDNRRSVRDLMKFCFVQSAIWFSPALLCWGHPLIAGEPDLKTINYQSKLNPQFVKVLRQQTRFIIIHSTESRLPSALRTLSKGKVRGHQYQTLGGHANYLLARNGKIYLMLDPKYRANHAGVSMWNGTRNLSDCSIGIELEGYHNIPFSDEQYRALRMLLKELQEKYSIKDRDVLEHYRIAFAPPNRYHSLPWRGRKLDPGEKNFDRQRAGLTDEYPVDPDVMAGRVGGAMALARATVQTGEPVEDEEEDDTEGDTPDDNAPPTAKPLEPASNRIAPGRSAWSIAGADYNASTTVYLFPDGQSLRGNQISNWQEVPVGTEVQMNVELPSIPRRANALQTEVILPETGPQLTPWKIANALYNSAMTYYVLPDGTLQAGNQVKEFKSLPYRSRVMVAFRPLKFPRTQDPLGEDLEDIYLSSQTLYLVPKGIIKSGSQIEDFSRLPSGTRVFGKLD